MHIAIDAHMVGERETGNETYIVNLAAALLRLAGRDPKGFSWDALGPPNATQDLPASQRAQQRRFGSSPRFELLATHPDRLHAALPGLQGSHVAGVTTIRPANALLRIPFGLPWAAWRGAFDLLHVTYNAPPLNPCPTVVTIHDISFEHYPQFFSPRDRLILKTLTPLSARRAAHILTGSQHTRRELIDRYRLSPQKITVTSYAADERFHPILDTAALQAVRAKYGIPDGPFVLALGNLQPRKNIARLVAAFGQVVNGERSTVNGERLTVNGERSTVNGERSTVNGERSTVNGERLMVNGERSMVNGERLTVNGERSTVNGERLMVNGERSMVNGERLMVNGERLMVNGERSTVNGERLTVNSDRSPLTVHRSPFTVLSSLVVAGKAQWRESEVYQAVQQAGLAGRVLFPGYVDDADLPALYSAAAVFVYPSLYEGFGLPPLEAMACGAPVISTRAASLPEVVGDAALLIDPTDTEALAQALADVLAYPELRADLRARGLRRAAGFSWERCAAETLAVYAQVLAERRGQ